VSEDRRTGQRREHLDDRTRLDEIAHAYEVWSRRTLVILAVIAVIALAGGITSAYLFFRVQNARENACLRTNARHDNAIHALKEGSDQDIANAPTEAAKKEIARRRDVTISLINAIAPHLDCNNI
jgi:uncharacterized protein HemX